MLLNGRIPTYNINSFIIVIYDSQFNVPLFELKKAIRIFPHKIYACILSIPAFSHASTASTISLEMTTYAVPVASPVMWMTMIPR